MATKITSYNPCKNDPYGASSMPIYQVSDTDLRRQGELLLWGYTQGRLENKYMLLLLQRSLDNIYV